MRWARVSAHGALAAFLLRFAYPRIDAPRRRALMGWWSGKLLRILEVTVEVAGELPPASGGAMIAANHISWLDIFLIASVRPTRFVAKDEVREWPIAGWIADRAGTVFMRRDQWRDTARINTKVNAALAAGDCVGFFPEGFTTEGDKLLPFHAALFEPAVASSEVVRPAAIRYAKPDGAICREASFIGERSFMESLGLIIGERRIVARLEFGAPLATQGRHRRDVARAAQLSVANLLGVSADSRPDTRADR